MTTASDQYWEDRFRDFHRQTDREIQDYLERQDQPDLQQNPHWAQYCSSLIESQRLQQEAKARHRAAVKEIEEHAITLLPNSPWSHRSFHHLLDSSFSFRCKMRDAIKLATARAETTTGPVFDIEAQFSDVDNLPALLRILKEMMRDAGETEIANSDSPTTTGEASGGTSAAEEEESETVQMVSSQPFTLEEVPRAELQRRLNRGEIAPREEWLPSHQKEHDVSTRKKIEKGELIARLDFGERLRKEAAEALAKNDLIQASTLYAQGVHLLESVTSATLADALSIQEHLSRFRRNKAIVDIKLRHFREAIQQCEAAFAEDNADGKALFLKSKAQRALGEYDEAKATLDALVTSPYAPDDSKKAGRAALVELLHDIKKSNLATTKLISAANAEISWADGRGEQSDPRAEASSSSPTPMSQSRAGQSSTAMTAARPAKVSAPSLSVQAFVDLLRDQLRLYTTPLVSAELEKIRFSADYDEKKTLLKLRKYLPSILTELYRSYGLGGPEADWQERKAAFDKALAYFQTSPAVSDADRLEIRDLVRRCRDALFESDIDM